MPTTFTRRKYDDRELEMNDASSAEPSNYATNLVSREHPNFCYNIESRSGNDVNQPLNSNGRLNFELKADVENKLQNRHVTNNNVDRTNKDYTKVELSSLNTCSTSNSEFNSDTRFTHPITDFRGMYTANYNFTPYLHVNPQDVILKNKDFLSPNRLGVSSRYETKEDIYNDTQQNTKQSNFNEIVSGLLPK